jgi:hypothetical protein
MQEDIAAAKRRESELKSAATRRLRWIGRDWRTSWAGNDYLNADGFNVVVYPKGKVWGARVEHRASGYWRASQRPYATADEAKLAAYDQMIRMKDATTQT